MKEQIESAVLAGAGAAGGLWKYGVRPELTPGRGWLAIGAVVAAFDALGTETLSSASKTACEASTWLKIGIGYTALHLMGVLPERLDLIHQASEAIRLVAGGGGPESPRP